MTALPPETLFVIACPVCHGHMAATGSLCGRDACCPLCANLFHVPVVHLPPGTVAAIAPQPPLAEDWGRVIDTLAPPVAQVETRSSEPETPSDFELTPPEAASSQPTPAPDASAPLEPSSTRDELAATEAFLAATPTISNDSSGEWIDQVLAASDAPAPPDDHGPPEGFPHLGPEPIAPTDHELTLREPVRTIRRGDTVIEIRRLTPEERRVRRLRRNLMMVVIAISILMAIVIVFGVPQKPTRRQPSDSPIESNSSASS